MIRARSGSAIAASAAARSESISAVANRLAVLERMICGSAVSRMVGSMASARMPGSMANPSSTTTSELLPP
jgi:hypothetical protein